MIQRIQYSPKINNIDTFSINLVYRDFLAFICQNIVVLQLLDEIDIQYAKVTIYDKYDHILVLNGPYIVTIRPRCSYQVFLDFLFM